MVPLSRFLRFKTQQGYLREEMAKQNTLCYAPDPVWWSTMEMIISLHTHTIGR